MDPGTHDETSDPLVRRLISARRPLLLIGLAGALGVMVTDFDFGLLLLGLGYAASWLPAVVNKVQRSRTSHRP